MEILILLPFVLACAVSDLRTLRIPNSLILCGLVGALLFRCFSLGSFFSGSGPAGTLQDPSAVSAVLFILKTAADALAGFLLPWLLFGPLAALKMAGGGDVKLLSVIGLWVGARDCLKLMWYSLLFAAAWSVVIVIRRRNLLQRMGSLSEYVKTALVLGKLTPYRPGTPERSGEFCFAVPGLAAYITLLARW